MLSRLVRWRARPIARSIWRSGLLLGMLLAARADGVFRKRVLGMRVGAEGAVWVHGWCRRMVRVLGIECTVAGVLPECGAAGRAAVVSNHLSYLDILVYAAARPFVMVAKSEVRDWPLLGWMTAQAGTVYVQRANVKGGRTQTHAEVNAAMAEAFRSGLPVLFFPEGTTTDGSAVLPFRRGLFHSVLADGVPVRVAAVAYAVGERHACVERDVCFWGEMVFGAHLFWCLGLRGLRARVGFGEETVAGGDRFSLAAGARELVVGLYGELGGAGMIEGDECGYVVGRMEGGRGGNGNGTGDGNGKGNSRSPTGMTTRGATATARATAKATATADPLRG